LVYLAERASQQPELTLVVRSVDGTERLVLVESLRRFGGHAFQLHWSPDGRFLLAQGRTEQGVQGIYRIDPRTGHVTPIVQAPAGAPFEWPVWCSDGRIICTRWAPWTNVVVALHPERGLEQVLHEVRPPMAIAHLSVSPDGTRLAFVAWDASTGRTSVNVSSSEGEEARELIELPAQALGYEQPVTQLAWTPESRSILCASSSPDRRLEVFEISLEGGTVRHLGLTMEGVLPWGLSIHPDRSRLAFVAGLPPTMEVWSVPALIPG
jgi:Tol biopolymer transport system component